MFYASFCLGRDRLKGGVEKGRKIWRMDSGRRDVMPAIVGEGELSCSGEREKEKGGEYPR